MLLLLTILMSVPYHPLLTRAYLTMCRAIWNCISDSKLDAVFSRSVREAKVTGQAEDPRCNDAKDLIRWCLQGEPSKRPGSMAEILDHNFFSRQAKSERTSAKHEHTNLLSMSPGFRKMQYHFFISHNKREASGDVGTLLHLFEERGAHCWRERGRNQHKGKGTKEGIRDSAVFILFLTNSALSQP